MEENKGQRIYKTIMLVVIVMIVTSLVTAVATYKYLSTTNSLSTVKTTTSMNSLEYTLAMFRSQLEQKYMGEIDDQKLIEGAIKGYIEALGDPYTVYYTSEEMQEIMEQTNGNYVGIGIYMTLDTDKNLVTVLNPIENSPAEEAGILSGDLIIKVDGVEYTGDDMDVMASKIKGEEGTKVTLEIERDGEIKTFELTRRKVYLSHVSSKVLEDNIGYMSISDFDGGCAEEFKKEYEELEKQGITRLIIDIRSNGGGIVDEAIDIADMITDKGSTLLITKDKNGTEKITKATSDPIINMPVVVLINGYSASASEILAGALRDNEKATLVGTKTYGKGIIQELHQLSNGSGLKMTTNEYYTPNHNAIHKIGIEPDVEVELSDELKLETTVTENEDNQLQKAIEVIKLK